MKNYLALLIILIFIFNLNNAYAKKIEVKSTSINIVKTELDRELTRWEALIFLWNYFKEIPESYKYISLKFKNLKKDSKLYLALQKLVYLDLIENKKTYIYWNKEINSYLFYKLSEKILWKDFIKKEEKGILKEQNANWNDLMRVIKVMKKENNEIAIKKFAMEGASKELKIKQAIFIDTYNTIFKSHYNKTNLSQIKIWNSAIDWLAKWTNDKYTAYFPPVKNQTFYESLNWEYEWIWSYVDMITPWEVKIVSPITWSPSQKAWLKWWDIIIKVDWKEIKNDNSLLEVVSWIKGPAWTKVILTINREWREIEITVIRWKIVIKDVEYKLLNRKTFYINIKSFWNTVSKNFKSSLEELKKKRWVTKVIIDLRNNWWWYLEEVSDMLWYFIEKWESTAIVEYLQWDKEYKSEWYKLIDFSKYKIVLLQNSGTASASEIMIWTIKDYYPKVTIIWEQSYWKGSVQTIKAYSDGSSFKYTIAKWFTWKTRTWIDGGGIIPDIEIKSDMINNEKDEVLNKARNLR